MLEFGVMERSDVKLENSTPGPLCCLVRRGRGGWVRSYLLNLLGEDRAGRGYTGAGAA